MKQLWRILGIYSASLCLVPGLLAQEDGLSPVIGGLPFDSGFALGLRYRKYRLASGPVDFRALVIGSVKKYEYLEIEFDLPRLWNERLFARLATTYRNYPEEDLWGLGPESEKSRRSNFRLEDINYTGTFGLRPRRWVRVGVTGGLLDVNTGPGKDKDSPSVEQRFTPMEVPALDQQPDYWHMGAFAQVDYRDEPSDPRSGGNYEFRWAYYDDRDFGRFSFRRYEVELKQFFPVSQKGAIAARGLSSLTDTSPGHQVPFFLQRTVGGGNDLRGFHQYRFRDKNILVFNLEYRWRVIPYLDLVAFGDAGRVFPRRSDFGLNDLEGSFGLGGRLKFRESVFLGMDLGVGREGLRVWFRGGHTF